MANMDFSQAFTYSDIGKVYLMAVELSGGLVSQHGSVQLERIFQDSTLYAQVSALKNEMESILQNFTGASEYDDTATYAVGDYCTKDDYLYQCNTAVSAESWDASKWDVVTISSQYTMLKNILGVDDYSTSASYAVGDLVVYNGKMYRCITAVSSEVWDASKWSETSFVAEVESVIADVQAEGATQIANVQAVYSTDLGNVSSRVQSNSKRIANLEDKSAPYTIEYPSADYGKGDIPASIEKGAVVKSVDGNTRPFCQLCKTDSNSGGATSGTVAGVTWSLADGVVTLNGTASANGQIIFNNFSPLSIPSGHVLMLSGRAYSASYGMYEYAFRNSSNSIFLDRTISATEIKTLADDVTSVYFAIRFYSGNTFSNQKMRVPQVYDLTLIFGAGNEPSTVTEAIAQIPALGRFNAFDTGSLVTLKVGGYRSVGPNLWDEETKNGYYINATTGVQQSASGFFCSQNYIKVAPNTAYWFNKTTGQTHRVFFYDINKNFLSSNSATTLNGNFVTPTNCHYMMFWVSEGSYSNDIQICLNSYPDKTTYHPHKSQTVEFSSPVELGGAGSVKDKLDVESGTITRNVAEGDFGDVSWVENNASNGTFYFYLSTLGDATGITSSRYQTVTYDNRSTNMSICGVVSPTPTSSFIFIHDENFIGYTANQVASALSGEKFTYALSSPTTEPISLPSAIEVEPYGTIELIQEQDVEIDTEFSVQYIPDSQYIIKSMVVDNLSSESTDVPLSANQGRILAQKIARNTKEIANLIQKEGEVSISYPDSIYGRGEVPSGMAKFAEVSCLRGVSRVANNIFKDSEMRAFSGSVTVSNGVATWTGDGIMDESTSLTTISGHVYILAYTSKNTISGTTDISNYHEASATRIHTIPTSAGFTRNAFIFTSVGTVNSINFRCSSYVSGQMEVKEIILTDLNTYFGSDPSVDVSALTISDIQQSYPELLEPSDYDTGSPVDTTYGAVESEGRNLFDKDSVVEGYQLSSSGEPLAQASMCYSDKMVVTAGETYTISGAGNVLGYASKMIFGYDADDNLLQSVSADNTGTGTITIANGVAYIRVNCVLAYIDTCQLELGSTATSYSPYFKSTLTLPEPVTRRSAGSVADTDELCVEVSEGVFKRRQTKRIGSYTFTGDESWAYASTVGHLYFRLNIASWGAKRENSPTERANMTISGYLTEGSREVYNNSVPYSACIPYDNDIIMVYDPSITSASDFASHMAGRTMRFELAEPSVTLLDPILDNFVPTEAGGTITPRQTQTKQIDAKFDINYMAL